MLVDRHMLRAMRYAVRMTGDVAHAEDIVQEAFEVIWTKAQDWKPIAGFSTWFYKVIANIASRRFRDRLRGHAELDENMYDQSVNAEEFVLRNEATATLEAALQALPERQRQAIVLFYYEDLSQQEACAVMDISEGALESLLSRGRSNLRSLMESRQSTKRSTHVA